VPEPAALPPAERKVAARRVARRAARRGELVMELRVAESVIGYAVRQLSNGIGPEEAAETALEASAQLSRLAVVIRKSVRLPAVHRRVLVSKLADLGYTQEAIGLRAGVSVKTVQRDLARRHP
jgi:DNA-directed RNA polymerase specialized sigma24 family protein